MADSGNKIYRKQNFLGEYIINTTCKEGLDKKQTDRVSSLEQTVRNGSYSLPQIY